MNDPEIGSKLLAIEELARKIDAKPDWWRFPEEQKTGVRGFLGIGPIFVVGEQPSFSEWGEDHEHRRALYNLMKSLGLQEAHLTDLYKRRGRIGELRRDPLPSDFDHHLDFFAKELEVLKPSHLLVMGTKTFELVTSRLPAVLDQLPGISAPVIQKVWHFGSVAYGNRQAFEQSFHSALRAAR